VLARGGLGKAIRQSRADGSRKRAVRGRRRSAGAGGAGTVAQVRVLGGSRLREPGTCRHATESLLDLLGLDSWVIGPCRPGPVRTENRRRRQARIREARSGRLSCGEPLTNPGRHTVGAPSGGPRSTVRRLEQDRSGPSQHHLMASASDRGTAVGDVAVACGAGERRRPRRTRRDISRAGRPAGVGRRRGDRHRPLRQRPRRRLQRP
jgi:hypothetical protein